MAANIKIDQQTYSLPVITISTIDTQSIINELKEMVIVDEDAEQLIPCILNIDEKNTDGLFIAQLVEIVRQVNLLPVGICTENAVLSEQAAYAGIATFNEQFNLADCFKPATEECFSSNTVSDENGEHVHYGNVESGEQVYAEGKSLIVLGDVKAGAEVVADGNIHVGGTLSGSAYAANAGAINVDDYKISAYCFEPEVISISGFYQVKEDIPKSYFGLTVSVSFIDNKMKFSLG